MTSVFGYGSLTLYGAGFHPLRLTFINPISGSYNPGGNASGLGFSAFARHYLRNRLFSLYSSGY